MHVAAEADPGTMRKDGGEAIFAIHFLYALQKFNYTRRSVLAIQYHSDAAATGIITAFSLFHSKPSPRRASAARTKATHVGVVATIGERRGVTGKEEVGRAEAGRKMTQFAGDVPRNATTVSEHHMRLRLRLNRAL